MKKKLILMGLAGVCVVTAIVGGTLASQNASTKDTALAEITTKELSIAIYSNDTDVSQNVQNVQAKAILVPDKMLMPGTVIDEKNTYGINLPLYVVNDAAGGYDTYIKVHIYRTWLDENDKKLSELNMNAGAEDAGIVMAGWSDKWIYSADESTNEDIVLYYTEPVKAGDKTDDFLKSITVNENLGNNYADKHVGFEVEADAVQALPAEDNQVNADGIMSAWGMEVTFETGTNTIATIK